MNISNEGFVNPKNLQNKEPIVASMVPVEHEDSIACTTTHESKYPFAEGFLVPQLSNEKEIEVFGTEIQELRNLLEDSSTPESIRVRLQTGLNKLEQEYNKMKDHALVDGLTGLPNRSYFDKEFLFIQSVVERQRESGLEGYALLAIDLDGFKGVNDTHGHPAGDLALSEVARILKDVARKSDFPARVGGDEFVVLLPNTTEEGAELMGERIIKQIESEVNEALSKAGYANTDISASVGVVAYDRLEIPQNDITKMTDKMLYQAKEKGKRQVVTLSGALRDFFNHHTIQ